MVIVFNCNVQGTLWLPRISRTRTPRKRIRRYISPYIMINPLFSSGSEGSDSFSSFCSHWNLSKPGTTTVVHCPVQRCQSSILSTSSPINSFVLSGGWCSSSYSSFDCNGDGWDNRGTVGSLSWAGRSTAEKSKAQVQEDHSRESELFIILLYEDRRSLCKYCIVECEDTRRGER